MADDVTADSSDQSTDQQATDQTTEVKSEIDWKAKSREWESKAKANKTAADELAALKQAQMTEQERLTAQLGEATKQAETARTEALRLRIAVKHGVSDEDADLFLTGTDEETLTRQAQRLASREQDRRKSGNHVPREGTNTSAPENENRQFMASLFGGGD